MSKLYAHIGTILAAVAAGGTDFGAFHASPTVQAVLTAVAGVLVACHILSPATVGTAVSDVRGVVKAVESVAGSAVGAYRSAATPATKTATSQTPPPA